MIFFDHTYTNDQNHRFWKKLKKYGFNLLDQEVEHPGKAFCTFISFNGDTNRGYHYLEFVNVKKGGVKCSYPGLAFGYKKGLRVLLKKIKNKFDVKFEHKNYNWKEDNKSDLPGWNFLTFKKLKFRGITTWFNEFEKHSEDQKNKIVKVTHPNGVQKFSSLHFELNDEGLKFYEELFGKKIKNGTRLACGTMFYYTKAKSNKMTVIHLECKSLKKLKGNFPYDGALNFLGKEAVRIRNPNLMWDIVITE